MQAWSVYFYVFLCVSMVFKWIFKSGSIDTFSNSVNKQQVLMPSWNIWAFFLGYEKNKIKLASFLVPESLLLAEETHNAGWLSAVVVYKLVGSS